MDDADLDDVLCRCLEGNRLDRSSAYRLMCSDWKKVREPLLQAAGALRNKFKGRKVSYSRKVFLPLTNLCRDFCGYCTYRKDPSDPRAKTMSPDEVRTIAETGERVGCTEALFMAGERPEQRYEETRTTLRKLGYRTTIEYMRDMCELVIKKTNLLPHSNPGTMSRKELAELKNVNASLGMMLENVSERLCRKGGPHEFASSKHPGVRLATIENAGQLKVPFTTGLLIGIGEESREIVDSLFAIRDLHDRYGHIQEIIIQNFRAKADTPMTNHPEPSTEYAMRVAVLARLIFGGEMNIQIPPNLSREYGGYLDAGINDWGGVSPLTIDYVNPEAAWPQVKTLKNMTEARNFVLKHRLPIYPEYVVSKQGFTPEPLYEKIRSMADAQGFAKEPCLD